MGFQKSKNNFRNLKTSNLGSLLIKLSQLNFNLQSSDSNFFHSYLIFTTTVLIKKRVAVCTIELITKKN